MKQLYTVAAMAAIIGWPAVASAGELEFSAPQPISGEDRRIDALELALDAQGRAHVVWVDKGPVAASAPAGGHAGHAGHGDRHHARDNLYYVRGDHDLRFGAPVQVNRADGEVWGFAISRPRVQVAPSGSVHVMYPANATREGRAPEVVARYVRSEDGREWSEPRTLNTPAGTDHSDQIHGGFSAVHVFGTLGVAPDGAVHAFWIDTRGLGAGVDPEGASAAAMAPAAVWGAVSRDDGLSFAQDTPIIETDVCPCCQLTTAFADEGDTVFLGLRQVTIESYRDNVLAASRDGGNSYAAPVRLNEERWRLEGCPMKPTAIAVDGKHVYTAWYSGAESPPGVYVTTSRDGGYSFSAPQALHPEASLSDAPSVTVAGGSAYVTWHARADGARKIYVSVSHDHGERWSAPIEVPGPPGGGGASHPLLAAQADGSVLVAWVQDGRAWISRTRPATRSAALR